MSKTAFLKLWTLGTGAMDALTGLLLVLSPAFVLGLLGIAPPAAEALTFVSWIGIFVMAVGLSYAFALSSQPGRGETVWSFTALIRLLVALFLTVKITTGALVPAWGIVAASDAAVALVQILILRKGWWREVTA